jgi:hypothetical protein
MMSASSTTGSELGELGTELVLGLEATGTELLQNLQE